MNIGGIYLFGKPNEIFIKYDTLYRRIWETKQTYHDEKVITKNELLLCMERWCNNERPSD